jgi:hypothetical protein
MSGSAERSANADHRVPGYQACQIGLAKPIAAWRAFGHHEVPRVRRAVPDSDPHLSGNSRPISARRARG